MTDFDVHVVLRSSKAGPAGRHDGVVRLRVSSPPTEGRANAEAEKLLSSLLKTSVRLVRGARSRRKTFHADLPAGELDRMLRDVFGL